MVGDEAQTGGVRSKKQRGEKKGARNTETREKGGRDGVEREEEEQAGRRESETQEITSGTRSEGAKVTKVHLCRTLTPPSARGQQH